jgi:predicted enzyme related to lactoylglutathione lyase
MAKARLGRVALEVADVDAAAADFNTLFGLEFKILDIPSQSMRVAIGDHGLEFVQVRAPGWTPKPAGQLMGACIAVEDVERSRAHLQSQGHDVIFSIPLQSGRKEYVFNPIHGIPILIYQECGHFDLIAQ